MLVIFEGFDRSGKTTLAEKLCSDYILVCNNYERVFKYFKSVRQMGSGIDLEDAIKYDWYFMLEFFKQTDCCRLSNFIFDRSFVSQYAYSMVFRESNILEKFKSFGNYRKLFDLYASYFKTIPHLFVYCYRDNYDGVVDDICDVSRYRSVNSNFESFFDSHPFLNMVSLSFNKSPEENYNIIKNLVKERVFG